ncbi:hypothetical protein [Corynebacterium sp.]|nr:hypothetical protein [Corynebacterium sp.]
MIPFIWLRLVLLVAFGIFVAVEGLWWVALVALALCGLSVWQLVIAYRQR